MGPASQLGDAGGLRAKEGRQQASGHGQADAFGLGRGRKTGEAVSIEDHGPLELALQGIAFGAQTFTTNVVTLRGRP